jgi:hypothetical protein
LDAAREECEIVRHDCGSAVQRLGVALGAGIAATLSKAGESAAMVHLYHRAGRENLAMKILRPTRSRRQDGVAIVVILVLLSVMLLYVTANVKSVRLLGRELKLIEQRQVQRWNSRVVEINPASKTNLPAGVVQTPPR